MMVLKRLAPLLLFPLFLNAQQSEEKVVEKAVEALRYAMVHPDAKKLEQLVASSLSYGHSNGVLEDKAQFIESLVTGKYKFLTLELTDQTVAIHDNLAIVRHKFIAATHDKGKPKNEARLGILQVWRKVNGTWLLTARQSFKL